MKKITVLGAGMVGSAIGLDLAKKYEVTSVDLNPKNLSKLSSSAISLRQADLGDAEVLREVILECDLVVCAVPGHMGFETLKVVLEEGIPIVDISFLPEDPFDLQSLARQKGIPAVVDCGVAPGLCNLILGSHCKDGSVSTYKCFVGGLPVVRTWPFEYKAPFSPIDVIEEYTRPARLVENGHLVERPALSEPEFVEIEEVGTLEAFNTDGLRSLLRSVNVPNMVEKTMRYPGHINYMRMLRESGFFSVEPVAVGGTEVRPLEMTTRLLFPLWKLESAEEEFTAMRVVVETKAPDRRRHTYNLFDRRDRETGISSMARTTGYTATSVVRAVLGGKVRQVGIIAPEGLASEEGVFESVLSDLQDRGIRLRHKVERL